MVSYQSLKQINLYEHRAITSELDRRLAEYHPHAANALQVADVFVSALGANVRLYSNYLRNYSLTLRRLDRATASNAALRTFLEPREVGLVRSGYYKCVDMPVCDNVFVFT